jgi:hypothetical protein
VDAPAFDDASAFQAWREAITALSFERGEQRGFDRGKDAGQIQGRSEGEAVARARRGAGCPAEGPVAGHEGETGLAAWLKCVQP